MAQAIQREPLATPLEKIVMEWFTGHWWESRLVRQRMSSGLVPGKRLRGQNVQQRVRPSAPEPVRDPPVYATHLPLVGDDDVGDATENLVGKT